MDYAAFRKAELARRYPSTAGSQPAVDATAVDDAMAAIDEQGFVVVEDAISPAKIEEIREDVLPRFEHRSGRNDFEGFATRRLYSAMNQTFVMNELVEHPFALGLLDRLFEPNYLLSQLQVIDILPGEAAQPLHHDDGFYPWPRPRPPLGAATIFAIDDFTVDNGATRVVPGSHLWDDHQPDEAEAATAIPCVMPAGSMLFFVGTLWHGGGANRSAASRMCVTAQYCQPYCRQQENFSLSVDRERARACSASIQRLLGYSIHPPFMGFVSGAHPRRLLDAIDSQVPGPGPGPGGA